MDMWGFIEVTGLRGQNDNSWVIFALNNAEGDNELVYGVVIKLFNSRN